MLYIDIGESPDAKLSMPIRCAEESHKSSRHAWLRAPSGVVRASDGHQCADTLSEDSEHEGACLTLFWKSSQAV